MSRRKKKDIEEAVKAPLTLQEQAEELLKQAEEKNVQTNFFFRTTFKRYQVQIKIMNELEQKIIEDGALVTKEYVKGRQNIYTNPAITEYNKTSTAANQTVATLIKIIAAFSDVGDGKEENNTSKLEKLLSGFNFEE